MKLPPPDSALGALMARFPRRGRVDWLGVRPARGAPMRALREVRATTSGLEGDRFKSAHGKRAITLIQAEHIPVIAALTQHAHIGPETLRRNVVVSGIALIALKGQRFRIGDVLLEGTSPCDPCSKMEIALGDGAYNAMRGHGGLCARILEPGTLRLGDDVIALTEASA